jgi:hypothetical protein
MMGACTVPGCKGTHTATVHTCALDCSSLPLWAAVFDTCSSVVLPCPCALFNPAEAYCCDVSAGALSWSSSSMSPTANTTCATPWDPALPAQHAQHACAGFSRHQLPCSLTHARADRQAVMLCSLLHSMHVLAAKHQLLGTRQAALVHGRHARDCVCSGCCDRRTHRALSACMHCMLYVLPLAAAVGMTPLAMVQ